MLNCQFSHARVVEPNVLLEGRGKKKPAIAECGRLAFFQVRFLFVCGQSICFAKLRMILQKISRLAKVWQNFFNAHFYVISSHGMWSPPPLAQWKSHEQYSSLVTIRSIAVGSYSKSWLWRKNTLQNTFACCFSCFGPQRK